ncbi:MAG TPA: hypothetical protein VIL97_03110 [Thermoanaerobaculia bacterium]
MLRGAVHEKDLHSIARSLARIDAPETEEEIALASALAIDRAGVNAMIQRFIGARRHGSSALEIARAELDREEPVPPWMPEDARELLRARRKRGLEVCRGMIEEA